MSGLRGGGWQADGYGVTGTPFSKERHDLVCRRIAVVRRGLVLADDVHEPFMYAVPFLMNWAVPSYVASEKSVLPLVKSSG